MRAATNSIAKGEPDVRTKGFVATKSLLRFALGGLLFVGLAASLANGAKAQEIQPYDFTPLPAGTNLALGYYVYGHQTDFNVAGGSTIKGSGLEVNVGVARYVHFVDVGGHPAGFQITQSFGSLSAAHIDGQRLGSAFGAQTTGLSAFIWPYVNTASKTNVNTTFWIYPPTSTYDSRSPINLGDNRWKGDFQLGLGQGIGDHFSFDLGYDVTIYGDNGSYVPGFRRLSEDPTHRLQSWANWRWSPAFTTSIGYTAIFGGDQKVNGFFDGSKTEVQRIRANAALFLTPRLQTMLEVNHDVKVTGGFKQEIGATLRVLFVF